MVDEEELQGGKQKITGPMYATLAFLFYGIGAVAVLEDAFVERPPGWKGGALIEWWCLFWAVGGPVILLSIGRSLLNDLLRLIGWRRIAGFLIVLMPILVSLFFSFVLCYALITREG